MGTIKLPTDARQEKRRMPCCPNHGEPLEGLPNPLTSKGTGMCPVSGCWFDYTAQFDGEDVQYEKEANGELKAIPTYKIIGEEK